VQNLLRKVKIKNVFQVVVALTFKLFSGMIVAHKILYI